MFQKANVEKIINIIVAYVKLFQLLKCLDTLNFFQFASRNVKHSHVFKRCADVSKAFNDGVIKFEVLKACQDFTCNLQVVAWCVDTQLNFRQQGKFRYIDPPKRHAQKLFV